MARFGVTIERRTDDGMLPRAIHHSFGSVEEAIRVLQWAEAAAAGGDTFMKLAESGWHWCFPPSCHWP